MAKNRGGDQRIIDGEDEASLVRMLERPRDTEDRRLIVMRTFVDRFDRCRGAAVSLNGDYGFEYLGRRARDAVEEKLLFRTSHPPRSAADQDVAVHRR